MEKKWVSLIYLLITFILGFNIVIPIFSKEHIETSFVYQKQSENVPVGSGSSFWNVTTEPGYITPNIQIYNQKFWSFLLNNSQYTFMVKNNSGVWRNITSRFYLNYTDHGPHQKLQYDINIPYGGTYYLNFTFKMNVSTFSYNLSSKNCTLGCIDNGYPYNLNYNWSDMSGLSGFSFSAFLRNNKFNFSIRKSVVNPVHLQLDPVFTITSAAHTAMTWANDQRKMVRTSNGVLYVAYYDLPSSNGRIFLAESRDNGSTWSANKYQVTNNATTGRRNQTTPSIAITQDDIIYIAWRGQVPGFNSYFIRFRMFYLSNLSFSKNIINVTRTTQTTSPIPDILVDSNDNAYITWSNSSAILLRRYFHSNNTWQKNYWNVTTATSLTYIQVYPTLVIDNSNNVYVIFAGQAASSIANNIIRERKFWSSNSSFSKKIMNLTSESGAVQAQPSAVLDKDGNIDLVWHGTVKVNNIRYKKYWASNNTWNKYVTNITREPTWAQTNPTVQLDGKNNLHVLWYGNVNATGTSQLRISNYTASTNTWTNAENWTHSSNAHLYPSTMYAWFPNISGIQTNIPIHGVVSFYANSTVLTYLNSSRVSWGGEAASPSTQEWRDQGFWNVSFINSPYQRDFGFMNVSFSNNPYFRDFGYFNISFSSNSYSRDFGYWNESFSNNPVWNNNGYWNSSFSNTPSFRNLGLFNTSFSNNPTTRNLGFFNTSFSNVASTRNLGFFNVSFSNTQSFKNQGFFNTSFSNSPTQRNLGFFNVSFGNTPQWRNLGYWNISFMSSPRNRNFGFWNVSFGNSQSWRTQGFWNVSFSSPSYNRNLGFWNESFSNTQQWRQQGFFNVSFRNSSGSSWKNQGLFNISFSNVSSFRNLGFWNISFKNSPSFKDFGYFNVSFMNSQQWKQQGFFNTSFGNNPQWKSQGMFNISFQNTLSWKSQGLFNVSFSNSASWKNSGLFNISFSNVLSYKNQGYWNVSFKNTPSYRTFGFWNVSFMNTLSYKQQGYFNLSFRNSSTSGWVNQGMWNISFSNSQIWKRQGFFDVSFRNVSAGIDIYNFFPANGSGGIVSHSALYISINSSKGYKMNITWFGSTDNGSSWFYLGHNFNITNGTYNTGFFNATVSYHRYDWRVWTNDGHKNYNNKTLHYTVGVGGGGRGVMYEDGIYMIGVGLLIGFIIGPDIFEEVKRRKRRI